MPAIRSWPQGPRQRLPRTLTPFASEAVTSYAARLAHANHIGVNTLRSHIAETPKSRPRPDWLATVSGHPVHVIQTRLRGLAGDPVALRHNLRRTLCRRCMAGRGIHEPVYCYLPAQVTVCHRHRRWIGLPARALDDQLDLRDRPEVLRAARTHQRLTRQYPESDLRSALSDARHMLVYWAHAERREAAPILQTGLHAVVSAYPEVITVAATLLQFERSGRSTRSGAVTLLIDRINERNGTQHVDSTPVEQWIEKTLTSQT